MTSIRRLALFALVLAAAFGAAALAGAAIGPSGERSAPGGAPHGAMAAAGEAPAAGHDGAPGHGGGTSGHGGPSGHGGATLGGLAVSEGGLTLALAEPVREPGRGPLRLRILGPDGAPVTTGYDVEHTKRLHLIVVRRDTARFVHLHPRLTADGVWEVPANLPDAGDYRVVADFRRDGAKHALAADLAVPGRYDARPWPAPRARAATDTGGLEVARVGGPIRAGRETTLRFDVTRDGAPVDGLQPYLGAKGHLVALRAGDLGYLHVHPLPRAPAANQILFVATFPTPGRYRLFLQLRERGTVRTVALTQEVTR